MNKGTDIERLVMESHYLDALESESKASKSLSDMEREDYINKIESLRLANEDLRLTLKTMSLSLDSLNKATIKKDAMLKDMSETIKRLEAKLRKYEDMITQLNKNIFGHKSFKKGNSGQSKKSREQEKGDFDGSKEQEEETHTVKASIVPNGVDREKVKSEHLDRNAGPRGKYTTMDAARVIDLKSGIKGLPQGAKVVGRKIVEEYTKESNIQCTRFEVLIYVDKKGDRHEYYEPLDENDNRRPYVNTVPGTHGTPAFIADLVVDRVQVGIPSHREGIRMEIDQFTSSENTRNNWIKNIAGLFRSMMSPDFVIASP